MLADLQCSLLKPKLVKCPSFILEITERVEESQEKESFRNILSRNKSVQKEMEQLSIRQKNQRGKKFAREITYPFPW